MAVDVVSRPDAETPLRTDRASLEPGTILVRHAVGTDAAALTELIGSWAEVGLMLPRDHVDIREHVSSFVIAERIAESGEHELVASAALEIIRPTELAEVRSVAVDESARGTGTGQAVVLKLMEKAGGVGIARAILLTKTPGFFSRCGFEAIDWAELPEAYSRRLDVQGRSREGRTPMVRPC